MTDLKHEQQVSLNRPRYNYHLTAKLFFAMMDIITGKKMTLAKAKVIETLASIPYRAWECREYARMTRNYKDGALVPEARGIMEWGREAQDNEYWHLLVINEKMKEDGLSDPWYLFPVVPFFMVLTYSLMSKLFAFFNISGAFLFNAQFEDHAEHEYAEFVEAHPEWDSQPVKSPLVKEYGEYETWGDVFRRIGLDERDHMNSSFVYAGMPEHVVPYEGMPVLPGE